MRLRLVLACIRAYYIALVLAQSMKFRIKVAILATRYQCRLLIIRVLFSLLRLVLQVEKESSHSYSCAYGPLLTEADKARMRNIIKSAGIVEKQ